VQIHIDIPQGKVGLVIGKQAATINAIKTYAKVHCFVEQHKPDEERARVTVIGTAQEAEKCKQVINGLVSGAMNTTALFQLAGLPVPLGTDRPDRGLGALVPSPPSFTMMPAMLPTTTPPPGGGLAPGTAMPEEQVQANMNDYYAHWWSQYAGLVQEGGVDVTSVQEEPAAEDHAFDRAALARLAEWAAQGQHEAAPSAGLEATAASPDAQTGPFVPPPTRVGLAERASLEVRMLLGGTDGGDRGRSNPLAPQPAAPNVPEHPPAGSTSAATAKPAPARTLNSFTVSGFSTQIVPKAQKDNDSVQKMLMRLQGNVQQTKQAVDQNSQALSMARTQSALADGSALVFRNDGRSADPEWNTLLQRVQVAQKPDEIEDLGRDVIFKLPSLSAEQAVELLQKLEGMAEIQNGDFLDEVMRALIPRLKEFTSTQFTSVMCTFTAWSMADVGDKKRHAARFAEVSKSLFTAAASEMSLRLMEFAAHEINCCLAAFVSVGFLEFKLFASVGRAALARHGSFGPTQLTALLTLLSEMRLVHLDLFHAAGHFLATHTKELRPVDVTQVLRAFAKCNVRYM